MRNIPTFLY